MTSPWRTDWNGSSHRRPAGWEKGQSLRACAFICQAWLPCRAWLPGFPQGPRQARASSQGLAAAPGRIQRAHGPGQAAPEHACPLAWCRPRRLDPSCAPRSLPRDLVLNRPPRKRLLMVVQQLCRWGGRKALRERVQGSSLEGKFRLFLASGYPVTRVPPRKRPLASANAKGNPASNPPAHVAHYGRRACRYVSLHNQPATVQLDLTYSPLWSRPEGSARQALTGQQSAAAGRGNSPNHARSKHAVQTGNIPKQKFRQKCL